MNNSNNTTDPSAAPGLVCDVPWWFPAATKGMILAGYNISSPLCAIIVIPGYIFTLLVMSKQTSYDRAYYYQLFLSVSQFLEALTLVLLSLAFDWGGVDTAGWPPFQHAFVPMWYLAHLSIPFTQVTMYVSLFLAISMSIDRLYALLRPISYKNIDRRLHQYVALSISMVIAVATSTYNAFLFEVGVSERGYESVFNLEFAASRVGQVMTGFANFVRIFGLTTLVVCNICLIKCFRKRTAKAAMLVSTPRDDKERIRKKKERSLFVLTVCQSTFCAMKMTSEFAFYTGAYSGNFPCYDDLLAPMLDMFLEIVDVLDVIVPFIVSSQMRTTALRLCRRTVGTQITGSSAGKH